MTIKQLARAALCALALIAPLGASAAVLQTGESADFRVDLSAEGDVILNAWTASCFDRLVCPAGTGFFATTEMLQADEAFDFAIGSTQGATDLFMASFVNGTSAVAAVTEQISGGLSVAASVDELFLRITATNGQVEVSEASVRMFANGIDVLTTKIFEGVELSATPVVPLPASGMMLLSAGIGFAGMRWRSTRKRT